MSSTQSATPDRADAASSDSSCFHCGLPVVDLGRFRAAVLGEIREFCCPGCQAVAEVIAGSGLEDYYRLRTADAATASAPDAAPESLFDREDLQSSFVRSIGDLREASLAIDGVRCPACLWLNERRLQALPGVVEAAVSYPGHSARVVWDPSRVQLSGILAAVGEIGYRARPIDPSYRKGLREEAGRRDAERLVFAGILGMMVMSLALAAYFLGGPDAAGRLPLWETFGRWSCLLGATVLLAYPAQDFFAGAWRDLRRRRAGMDVPIVLGLLAAWAGSAWTTFRGSGPVYYDAIGMLVFFVLLARAMETRARRTAAAALDRFAAVEPATAHRVGADGRETAIAALDLSPADRIRVYPGEIAPADGLVLEGESSFDEAVLTGEPWPRPRGPGQMVVAGSGNRDQPVLLRVTRVGEDSTIGEVRRLLERGLASRPPSAFLADRFGAWLVIAVLALAGAAAAWWSLHDPAVALPATLSVLIVTCPCALALATPIALALAAGRLAAIGVLPARMAAIERLARADTVGMDKTGTLTLGTARLANVTTTGGLDREDALEIAGTLETGSLHPIARAIREAADGSTAIAGTRVRHEGQGISGIVNGTRWWIGSRDFAQVPTAAEVEQTLSNRSAGPAQLRAFLSDRRGRAALFTFEEELRPGARQVVSQLRAAGVRSAELLSGDASETVRRLGQSLGFDAARGEMTTADKLAWIHSRERSGSRVLFVGDGLNDAPTLAAAGASVSFAQAPQLSRMASDFLILGQDLSALTAARRIARRSRSLLIQNLAWAAAYNILIVPFAAAGMVPPWAAALGMSASSLLVVANAMRLRRAAILERLSASRVVRAAGAPAGPEPEPGR